MFTPWYSSYKKEERKQKESDAAKSLKLLRSRGPKKVVNKEIDEKPSSSSTPGKTLGM